MDYDTKPVQPYKPGSVDTAPHPVFLMYFRNFQLALLLLTEVKRGSESRWHPYIQTLPRTFDSLVHWSDKEIQELQYSSTYAEQRFIQEVHLAGVNVGSQLLKWLATCIIMSMPLAYMAYVICIIIYMAYTICIIIYMAYIICIIMSMPLAYMDR